jgi:hypothetical protein
MIQSLNLQWNNTLRLLAKRNNRQAGVQQVSMSKNKRTINKKIRTKDWRRPSLAWIDQQTYSFVLNNNEILMFYISYIIYGNVLIVIVLYVLHLVIFYLALLFTFTVS